jgi:hypothetical protein
VRVGTWVRLPGPPLAESKRLHIGKEVSKMLDGFQLEVVAGVDEYGDFFCLDCAADEFTKPIIRYSLDEEQAYLSEGMFEDDPDNHIENCGCEGALYCARCGAELTEGWTDPDCEERAAQVQAMNEHRSFCDKE